MRHNDIWQHKGKYGKYHEKYKVQRNMASSRKNMESDRKIIIGGLFSDGRKSIGIFFPFCRIFSAPHKNGGDLFSTSGGFFPTP